MNTENELKNEAKEKKAPLKEIFVNEGMIEGKDVGALIDNHPTCSEKMAKNADIGDEKEAVVSAEIKKMKIENVIKRVSF